MDEDRKATVREIASACWISRAGRTNRNTLGNGAYTDYGWDSRNRITSTTQKKSDGTVISSESHVYDDASRMTSKTVDSVVTSYTYDDIAQLTGESRTGYVCTYSYDANGSRLTKTLNDVTENYTYDDADKMLTAGSKSYTYDDAGRTTSVTSNNQTTTLSYDYESRLTQITYPNSSTNTFTYNALDTRVGKVDSGGTKAFKRDGVAVTAPVLSDGAAAYTPGVAERRGGASKFYHGDYLNSINRETDSSQATTATKQYDAFGMPLSSTGSSASPFGFAGCFGYQEDGDSGLKLLGHRYYDPSTGRFLTRDPAKDGRNWYGYCENDPSGAIDPDGLEREKITYKGTPALFNRVCRAADLVGAWNSKWGQVVKNKLLVGQIAYDDSTGLYGETVTHVTVLYKDVFPSHDNIKDAKLRHNEELESKLWLAGILVHELHHETQQLPLDNIFTQIAYHFINKNWWEIGAWEKQNEFFKFLQKSGLPIPNSAFETSIAHTQSEIDKMRGNGD